MACFVGLNHGPASVPTWILQHSTVLFLRCRWKGSWGDYTKFERLAAASPSPTVLKAEQHLPCMERLQQLNQWPDVNFSDYIAVGGGPWCCCDVGGCGGECARCGGKPRTAVSAPSLRPMHSPLPHTQTHSHTRAHTHSHTVTWTRTQMPLCLPSDTSTPKPCVRPPAVCVLLRLQQRLPGPAARRHLHLCGQ